MNAALGRAASIMRGFPAPWGIAGGWAIDLFLERQTRPHADVDIGILRGDQHHLRSQLSASRLEKIVAHALVEWPADEELQLPVHEVHATWPDGYHLELLLNEHDRQTHEWVFRRDPRIRRPLAATFDGARTLPYLAPEIVLLYKSNAPSAKDDADLASALPRLRAEQRTWLHQALALTAPDHPWADLLVPNR